MEPWAAEEKYVYNSKVHLELRRVRNGEDQFGGGNHVTALRSTRKGKSDAWLATWGKTWQPTLTGKDLKNLYWQQYDIPFGMVRLIYEGKEVWDDSILHEMGIRADCTLHVVLRLRSGGNLPGIVFSDVSDTSNVRKVQFSQSAPGGRFAAPRISAECNCACTPTHEVICTKSYGWSCPSRPLCL
ncbi:MAG: hypothetical protein J3R72DRAFT_481271 [Linnemannia gamsii]|nr:MAG: hypothetical protein J3R72DRAFT_481271 [Linnemannia gamsii]